MPFSNETLGRRRIRERSAATGRHGRRDPDAEDAPRTPARTQPGRIPGMSEQEFQMQQQLRMQRNLGLLEAENVLNVADVEVGGTARRQRRARGQRNLATALGV